MKTDVVPLPGLHGSIALFETFIALAPPWARCRSMELPWDGDQSFVALADVLEPKIRPLEGCVLFAESFAAPVAARLAARLGRKIALLVLCNPLVDAPLRIFPPLATLLLRSGAVPVWAVAHAMTGGDRVLAAAILREVRALPKEALGRRLAAACAAADDVSRFLTPPLLGERSRSSEPTIPCMLRSSRRRSIRPISVAARTSPSGRVRCVRLKQS